MADGHGCSLTRQFAIDNTGQEPGMRTYIKTDRDQTGKKKERKERTTTEWDLGINLVVGYEQASLMAIKAYASAQCTRADSPIVYILISGTEYTDQTKEKDNTTKGNPHVHIAIITKEAVNKSSVLSLVRPVKMGPKEYAKPRDGKSLSYYGWRFHHVKHKTKVDPDRLITFEFGDLPEDVWTSKLIKATTGVVNRHGSTTEIEAWIAHRKGIRVGMTDSIRKEKEVYEKMTTAKRRYEEALMYMEDTWQQQRDAEEEGKIQDRVDDMMDTIEDQKRKQARKSYFINQARKRRRRGL